MLSNCKSSEVDIWKEGRRGEKRKVGGGKGKEGSQGKANKEVKRRQRRKSRKGESKRRKEGRKDKLQFLYCRTGRKEGRKGHGRKPRMEGGKPRK
jgi:hypothetical protein